jgi:chromate transporter
VHEPTQPPRPPSPPPRSSDADGASQDAARHHHDPSQPPTTPGRPGSRPGLRRVLRYFLGLGTWGFGGPIATVGYMQRDLVERRGWLDRQDFLDGVALGQTMPGPLAAQVAMWVGFLARGALGALAVAAAFITPSFLAVLAVAVIYVHYQGLPLVQALFYGVAPTVMAIIALAAVKLARLTNRADRRLWAITLVIGVVTAVTGAEIALLFVAAGLLMVAWDAPPRPLAWLRARLAHCPDRAGAHAWPAVVLAATPALLGLGASTGTLVALGLFFAKAGAFIFGSGLAIVPFLREGVVSQHHWLDQRKFLDAVAMGLLTPGPVVISATFIGYLVGGLAGALIATAAIFTPIYLGVIVPGRWFVRHRDHPKVAAFVKGATAAAAGAIAGATVVLTRRAVTDPATALIALVSLGLLWRFKLKEPLIVLGGATAGILLHWPG